MVYEKNTLINFGKYKGQGTVEEVMKIDSKYLCWCISNVEFFKVSKSLEEEVVSSAMENKVLKRDVDVEDPYMDGILYPAY